MEEFFLLSLIISIFLTLALNFLSFIFPKTADFIQSRFSVSPTPQHNGQTDSVITLMQSIRPIELILIASLFLTIAINIGLILIS